MRKAPTIDDVMEQAIKGPAPSHPRFIQNFFEFCVRIRGFFR